MDRIILMADIIDSRKKDSVQLLDSFRNHVDELNERFAKKLLSPLTITLGDEFQGIISSLKDAVQLVFNLEEAIVAAQDDYKLRYVIFEGSVETPLNQKSAHGMLGEGLTKAREKLNSMKESDARVWVKLKDEAKTDALNNAFHLYTWLVDDWKVKDFEIISTFWMYNDYKVVAEKLNKNISLMWKREKSLNLREYHSIVGLIHYIV
ncbi:SatD family protein [Owenweeksia hongkongensis]|uniref:SatD family protein n=1 Tax=Owenweeksia hongkongensis TaxID=253245 RepID=UPI003A8F122C